MYRIGIDLGGTNIVAAVVDDNYNMVAKAKTPTAIPRTPDEIFDDIARVSKEAMAEAGITIADIKSVGIGTPGTVNAEGIIEYANNLGFDHVPAKQMLIDKLGCPNVYVENDANCAALGEAVAGCGHGAKDFVAVTLGTGVGSGIIIDGKIVSGANNAGGECGHTVIVVDGESCTCGRKGCWRLMLRLPLLSIKQGELWRNILIPLCTNLQRKKARFLAEQRLTQCVEAILQVSRLLTSIANM